MTTIALQNVMYIPRDLEPGTLYVSKEYAVAAHLCMCGCRQKVVVPLSPAEWSVVERNGRPTLRPSIGNWQLQCRSHYLITDGRIEWAQEWTEDEVLAGRQAEQERRQNYYNKTEVKSGFWPRLWQFVRRYFSGRR